MINAVKTKLQHALVLETNRISDARGHFSRQFCSREFKELGLPAEIRQVNRSHSKARHTLRGMHFQLPPAQEAKTVSCVRGSILDVFVDLREGSPTHLMHDKVTLRADEPRLLHVPKGFAHGFMTLEDDTEVVYYVDEFYDPGLERGIRWDDPALGIDWPARPAVISDRDSCHPDFSP